MYAIVQYSLRPARHASPVMAAFGTLGLVLHAVLLALYAPFVGLLVSAAGAPGLGALLGLGLLATAGLVLGLSLLEGRQGRFGYRITLAVETALWLAAAVTAIGGGPYATLGTLALAPSSVVLACIAWCDRP